MTAINKKHSELQLNHDPHNENAATNTRKNSYVEVIVKVLTVNIFFDGTLNNMFNSDLRTKVNPTLEDLKLQKELKNQNSFLNDLSNVALLFKACSKSKWITEKIYIQGSGSIAYEKDRYDGMIGSWGETGVYARVEEALDRLSQLIKRAQADTVMLNVFGFSRGSFFARYFCSLVKDAIRNEYYENNGKIITFENGRNIDIQINFAGLYDTVSSYGTDNYDDVKPFHLNIGSKQVVGHIVHLTAQNDYRYHFPLTRINTAVGDGIGFECSFPGAHSDIGGGYTANITEDKYLSTFNQKDNPYHAGEIHWQWFKEKGYYQGDPDSGELGEYRTAYKNPTIFSQGYSTIDLFTKVIYAKRIVPYKDYQFILAHGLQEIAKACVAMKFESKEKQALETGMNAIQNHPVLQKLDKQVIQFLLANYKKNGFYEFSLTKAGLSQEEQQTLYHDYLHNSLEVDSMIPGNNGLEGQSFPPKRAEINDNA